MPTGGWPPPSPPSIAVRAPIPIFATGNHDLRHGIPPAAVAQQRLRSADPAGSSGQRSAGHRAGLHHPRRRARPADRPTGRAGGGTVRSRRRPGRSWSCTMPRAAAVTAAELLRPRGELPPRAGSVIAGTDVRLVLAGHHHLAQSAMLGAVPVAVAGSTAIRTDPLAPAGHDRTFASGAFNLLEVYPDTIAVSVIPVDGAAGGFRPRRGRLPGRDRGAPDRPLADRALTRAAADARRAGRLNVFGARPAPRYLQQRRSEESAAIIERAGAGRGRCDGRWDVLPCRPFPLCRLVDRWWWSDEMFEMHGFRPGRSRPDHRLPQSHMPSGGPRHA